MTPYKGVMTSLRLWQATGVNAPSKGAHPRHLASPLRRPRPGPSVYESQLSPQMAPGINSSFSFLLFVLALVGIQRFVVQTKEILKRRFDPTLRAHTPDIWQARSDDRVQVSLSLLVSLFLCVSRVLALSVSLSLALCFSLSVSL